MGVKDTIIFVLYGLVILFVGNWLVRSKGKEPNSQDFFCQ